MDSTGPSAIEGLVKLEPRLAKIPSQKRSPRLGLGKDIRQVLSKSRETGSRDYQALRTLCGAAPVTKRSGKLHMVVMRYAAHVRLRNAVYHCART
jgi:hypothetical protein